MAGYFSKKEKRKMKLSDRLLMIASNVSPGESVADIGTDHGFLPLYLWEHKISPKVVFCDISEGSLQKAKDTCSEFYPDDSFDFRHGNGLDILECGEVDTITIAGMGGLLMCEILDWDMDKSKSFKKYVLQPRNNPGKLRSWLAAHNFRIVREQLVKEGKFICEILTVLTPDEKGMENAAQYITDSIYAEFPEMLLDNDFDILEQYLTLHLKKQRRIKQRIISGRGFSCNPTEDEEVKEIQRRIDRLNYLLSKAKEEK